MDVFNSIDHRVSLGRSEKTINKDQHENSESKRIQLKKEVSDEQVREKLATRLKDSKVDISKKARNHPGKKLQKADPPIGPGDILANDPSSEVTQDKLKKILEGNGFHFNEKERAALEEILYRS